MFQLRYVPPRVARAEARRAAYRFAGAPISFLPQLCYARQRYAFRDVRAMRARASFHAKEPPIVSSHPRALASVEYRQGILRRFKAPEYSAAGRGEANVLAVDNLDCVDLEAPLSDRGEREIVGLGLRVQVDGMRHA